MVERIMRPCTIWFSKPFLYITVRNNIICENKLLFVYSHNVVPIVMGPSREDYEFVVPKQSLIHVDDFKSAEEFANYLHVFDNNDQLYEQYFRWKDMGTIVFDTRYYCRLCAMLHDTERPPKHYDDINKWRDGSGVCVNQNFWCTDEVATRVRCQTYIIQKRFQRNVS